MRRATLVSAFMLSAILIWVSCRKIDYDAHSEIVKVDEKRFFTVPSTTNSYVKGFAKELEQRNSRANFVQKAVKGAGYPKWEKAFVARDGGLLHRSNNSDDSSSIVYIPFVQDNSNTTSAVLIIDARSSDTSYSLLWPSDYLRIGFDTTATGWNSRQVFQLFSEFDYQIFGHERWIMPDARIFGGENNDTLIVTRKGITGDSSLAIRGTNNYYEFVICFQYDYEGTNWGTVSRNNFSSSEPGIQMICNSFYWIPEGGVTLPSPVPEGVTWSQPPPPSGETGGGQWYPADPEFFFPNSEFSGGSVFFDNYEVPFIMSSKINKWRSNMDTSDLPPCIRAIVSQIVKSTDSTSLGRLLVKMDQGSGLPATPDKFKAKFNVVPNLGQPASTDSMRYNDVTGAYNILIHFDSAMIENATDLYIANVVTHELIHAYLAYIWSRKAMLGAIPPLTNTFGSSFQAYVDYINKADSAHGSVIPYTDTVHHNYMANNLIDRMAKILAAWDQHRITDASYYWEMAWEGLTLPEVEAWSSHWPNTPNWPPTSSYPSPNDNVKNGLSYALTLNRLDSIYNYHIPWERNGDTLAKGRKKLPAGCY